MEPPTADERPIGVIRRSLLIVVTAAAVAAAVGVGVTAAASGTPDIPSATSTPGASVGVRPAAAVSSAPTTSTASNTAREIALSRARAMVSGWPADKAQRLLSEVSVAFPTDPPPKPLQTGPEPAPGIPSLNEPVARVPGISNLREAPFFNDSFPVTNNYSQMVAGRWYVLYAGTIGPAGPSAGEGGVRVLSVDATTNNDLVNLGTFPAPGTTKLTVTAGSGTSVTLTADTGAILTFDLATLSFQ